MAIKLVKEVNGYTAEYWRIDRFDIEKTAKRVWLRLGLYKNADYAHTDGAKPVAQKEMVFSSSDYPVDITEISKADKNIFGELYKKVKEPVLKGTIDPESGELVDPVNINELTDGEDC